MSLPHTTARMSSDGDESPRNSTMDDINKLVNRMVRTNGDKKPLNKPDKKHRAIKKKARPSTPVLRIKTYNERVKNGNKGLTSKCCYFTFVFLMEASENPRQYFQLKDNQSVQRARKAFKLLQHALLKKMRSTRSGNSVRSEDLKGWEGVFAKIIKTIIEKCTNSSGESATSSHNTSNCSSCEDGITQGKPLTCRQDNGGESNRSCSPFPCSSKQAINGRKVSSNEPAAAPQNQAFAANANYNDEDEERMFWSDSEAAEVLQDLRLIINSLMDHLSFFLEQDYYHETFENIFRSLQAASMWVDFNMDMAELG